jgi:transcriptional regulator with XRE-family HTH domain
MAQMNQADLRREIPVPEALADLSRIREDAGISLEDVAEKTKISVRFLEAIESAEYEKLPGGIFGVSYLRQYAEAVGLSEGPLLTAYRGRMGLVAEAADKEPRSWRRWLRFAFPGRAARVEAEIFPKVSSGAGR